MNSNFSIRLMEPKPLIWWKSRKNKIDMQPPYQRRGRLWSKTDKAYLIDSILNGYDIPKLYMADFTVGQNSKLNKSKLPYAIIDGKQRLEAIFDFFNNEVTLNDDFVFSQSPDLKLGGLGYKDLALNYPDIAEIFETYPLTIMTVHAETEDPINELFVRLNRNKPLTGAEIRNAMSGPAPEVIRNISSHEFFVHNTAFSVKRGADLNTAAKLLMFEFEGKPAETKKKTLDAFVEDVKLGGPRDKLELVARRAQENLDIMSEVFLPKDKLLSSAGLIPVYYWFCRQNKDYYYMIREFLVDFESQRKVNRSFSAEGPTKKGLQESYVIFDNYNRSTNDQQSHTGRLDILNKHFQRWMAAESKQKKIDSFQSQR
ncbi:TPA: DUF262 domain-containing protein [Pseudomonas aeruginosa]|uniref:DUF262 domain-containing protein n=1 Tax=Pseudomonas aeruginosa TaxID=287 RepID=UPI0009A317EB|nr:DUF262 domain-containing protein [Pseudomonas aeruginosa]MDG4264060.1 DUF262 domain-containing protein [Pseudomonas aeruginosa]MDG4411713.1 DUF262 domain-containing protein [Pseudomonas aeruginosa]RPX87729.1 DUF262 domain-containing protein [Pseudomonas aeruginosa]UNE37878.1 DUF262 domain-containing protein [Pseudomonas aeruginosa]HBP6105974.1 DUF262 domain-containing protein [Pseudomonas aeruginosa]